MQSRLCALTFCDIWQLLSSSLGPGGVPLKTWWRLSSR